MCSSPAPATAMEEFQESDVLWPDQHHGDHDHGHGQHQHQHRGKQLHGDAARPGSSAPVGIPVMRSTEPATAWARGYDNDCCDGEASASASASASFVPPHEIAARRRCSEERAAFSVCVGHGRTLKGRDLRSVRTAVLRMTGFLES